MKLIIGNKNYSSWSLRGWLAAKQSGLSFEEIVVPLFGENWEADKHGGQIRPSSGKVPLLWDGDAVVWDNRRLMHQATPWPLDQPRVMWHSRIAGDPDTELALTA